MSAAVAAGAKYASKQKKKHKNELRKARAQVEQQRAKDSELAVQYVSGMISDPQLGTLSPDQCRDMLTFVTKNDEHEIDSNGLEYFLSTARKEGGTPADKPLSSRAVLATLEKYRFYLRNRNYVDTLISQWDIDANQSLNAAELRALIIHKEETLPPNQKREQAGVIIELRPTEQDIDYIMKECDLNGNGVIDKSELLIALAQWAEIAERKSAQSRACVVL